MGKRLEIVWRLTSKTDRDLPRWTSWDTGFQTYLWYLSGLTRFFGQLYKHLKQLVSDKWLSNKYANKSSLLQLMFNVNFYLKACCSSVYTGMSVGYSKCPARKRDERYLLVKHTKRKQSPESGMELFRSHYIKDNKAWFKAKSCRIYILQFGSDCVIDIQYILYWPYSTWLSGEPTRMINVELHQCQNIFNFNVVAPISQIGMRVCGQSLRWAFVVDRHSKDAPLPENT